MYQICFFFLLLYDILYEIFCSEKEKKDSGA